LDHVPPPPATYRPPSPTSPGSADAPASHAQDQPDADHDVQARWIARTLAASPPITAPVAARLAVLLTPIHRRTATPADAA